MVDGSALGLYATPAGKIVSHPLTFHPTAVMLPTTAIASAGISDAPAPAPATGNAIVVPPATGPVVPPVPFRVSTSRTGLNGAPGPSAVSTRSELSRRHLAWT